MDQRYADCTQFARLNLDREFLNSLRAVRPRVVAMATAVVWLQLLGSWALALYGPIWVTIVCFVVNCAVVQAMLLWTHEASHFSLTNDRRFNDIWCDVFFAGPIGMSVAAYRAKHLTHHAHLGTELDEDSYPYRFNIKGPRALALLFLKTFTGFVGISVALKKYVAGQTNEAHRERVSGALVAPLVTLVFNLGLLALCIVAGRWYLFFLLWAYPIVVIAIVLNIIRTIAEHQPEDYPRFSDGVETAMRPIVRTTVPNWFEKWLMYQANFNYHIEHHLFPAIPQHNLGLLHRHLRERGFYREFPGSIQKSGWKKFLSLSRNRTNNDFSDAVNEALSA